MNNRESEICDNTAKLFNSIEELINALEKMQIAEYIELMRHPFRLLTLNFLSGLARGIGFWVATVIIGAVILLVLERLVDLPLIGGYIAQLVRIVQQEL